MPSQRSDITLLLTLLGYLRMQLIVASGHCLMYQVAGLHFDFEPGYVAYGKEE